jgi:hypothetical protein
MLDLNDMVDNLFRTSMLMNTAERADDVPHLSLSEIASSLSFQSLLT